MTGDENTDSNRAAEINESINEMQIAMAEYDHAALTAAAQGKDPTSTPEVRRKLLEWHTSVMFAFTRLRPHIKDQLEDEFWDTEDTEKVAPLVVTTDEGVKAGLHILDDYHTPYSRTAQKNRRRHSGVVSEEKIKPDLLDAEAYRKITQLLSECRARLGFGPKPDKQTPRTEITEEDIEEVREWREQNLA